MFSYSLMLVASLSDSQWDKLHGYIGKSCPEASFAYDHTTKVLLCTWHHSTCTFDGYKGVIYNLTKQAAATCTFESYRIELAWTQSSSPAHFSRSMAIPGWALGAMAGSKFFDSAAKLGGGLGTARIQADTQKYLQSNQHNFFNEQKNWAAKQYTDQGIPFIPGLSTSMSSPLPRTSQVIGNRAHTSQIPGAQLSGGAWNPINGVVNPPLIN